MSKKLFVALAVLAACNDDATQEIEVEVGASVSDEARDAISRFPAALVATVIVHKEVAPGDHESVRASSTVLAAWCDVGDVGDVEGVVTAAIGPCTGGEVEIEVSLAPLLEGFDCTDALDEIEVAGVADHVTTVVAFELGDACGSYDGAVQVAL